jgi:hypothetical protein
VAFDLFGFFDFFGARARRVALGLLDGGFFPFAAVFVVGAAVPVMVKLKNPDWTFWLRSTVLFSGTSWPVLFSWNRS